MDVLYCDDSIVVCIKPQGILSTDEPGGVPEAVRLTLGNANAEIRTVHRLDRVVGGLMVLARSTGAAAELSRQIREGQFGKEYLAAIHGDPGRCGTFRDLMFRDKARKMSMITDTPGKGVQEAVLDYERLEINNGLSLVLIRLHTGRTHQIRCQFAAHGLELAGERKYSTRNDPCQLALWSFRLCFRHPETGEMMEFSQKPPRSAPWTCFDSLNNLKTVSQVP